MIQQEFKTSLKMQFFNLSFSVSELFCFFSVLAFSWVIRLWRVGIDQLDFPGVKLIGNCYPQVPYTNKLLENMEIHHFGNGVTRDFRRCTHFPVANGAVGRRLGSEIQSMLKNWLEQVLWMSPALGFDVVAVPMTSRKSPLSSTPSCIDTTIQVSVKKTGFFFSVTFPPGSRFQ